MRANLAFEVSPAQIAKWLSCKEVDGHPITNVVTSSKEATEGSLFVAICGTYDNGHDYIDDAIKRGAAAILCEELTDTHGIPCFCVKNSVLGLGQLAHCIARQIPHKTIAITGSFGKSTTKHCLQQLLQPQYTVHTDNGNYNNQIGVPMTMLSMPLSTDILIVELGMNHMSEISYLSTLCEPDLAIITAIGNAHIGELHSLDNICKAKCEIKDGMHGGPIFIPASEPLLHTFAYPNLLTCGINEEGGDFWLEVLPCALQAALHLPTKACLSLSLPTKKMPVIRGLLYSAAIGYSLGLNMEAMLAKVGECDMPAGRQEFMQLYGITIIDDAYNASPESVDAALALLYDTPCCSKKYILFGDMLELGDKSTALHEKVGERIAQYQFDRLYCIGSGAKITAQGAIRHGMDETAVTFWENDAAMPNVIDHIVARIEPGDILLVKGAHNSGIKGAVALCKSKLKERYEYEGE